MRISDWSSEVCSSDLGGIVGLSSFWVGQRRRSIGVRRALGATRGDILRYFQTENALIVGIGVEIGRASCRESGCRYGVGLGGRLIFKKKTRTKTKDRECNEITYRHTIRK